MPAQNIWGVRSLFLNHRKGRSYTWDWGDKEERVKQRCTRVAKQTIARYNGRRGIFVSPQHMVIAWRLKTSLLKFRYAGVVKVSLCLKTATTFVYSRHPSQFERPFPLNTLT